MTLCPDPRTFNLTLYNPSQARTGVDLAPLKAALTAANSKQMDTSMLSAPVAVMQATLLRVGVRARVRVRVRDAGHAQGV